MVDAGYLKDLDTWHHTRAKGTMCLNGGEVLLPSVSKSILIIFIQVFAM
jgi:hypothetical protein